MLISNIYVPILNLYVSVTKVCFVSNADVFLVFFVVVFFDVVIVVVLIGDVVSGS